MHHNQAIILNDRGYRESDKLINFYTEDFGKKEILAAGTRKIGSKLNPHLQYFAILDISFTKGKKIDRLTNAFLKINYFKVKCSLKAIKDGKFCLEVVHQLTKSYHPDKQIFNLLMNLFELLNNYCAIQSRNLLVSAFLIKLLSFLGYAPELHICLKCKNKVFKNGNFFSFKKGGLVCDKCHKNDDLSQAISVESIKILRLFLSEDLDVYKKIKIPNDISEELNKITINFLFFHLDPPAKILLKQNLGGQANKI